MILIVAIAVGALAAFALMRYVRGVEDDANAESELVPVLIVTQDIAEATTADVAQVSIASTLVPVEFRPANAVESLDQIAGKVAAADLATNQILVPGMFIDPQVASVSFADLLTENLEAVALSFDQIRAVGGYLAPGDEVNMVITGLTPPAETEEGADAATPEEDAAAAASPFQSPARYLYQRVKIIAIGNQLPALPGQAPTQTLQANGGGTIIFALPPDAVQRILSVPAGSLYLTLVPADYEATPLEPLSEEELIGALPGEDGRLLTPYGPEGFDAYVENGGTSSGSTIDATADEVDTSASGEG